MSFTSLGLTKDLLQAVGFAGYQQPTPIQSQVIPLILSGQDVIAQSKTGTGKTAGFALPILQLLQISSKEERRIIKALILVPTRELAVQVMGAIKTYGRNLTVPLRTELVVGGLNIDVQMRNLIHGTDIVVATPGRLLDVIARQKVDFRWLKFLVIDEADKMFDLGFANQLQTVLNLLPHQRQNLLFSATMTEDVKALALTLMPKAKEINVSTESPTVDLIYQRAILVNRNNRGPLLRHLIKQEHWKDVLVFVASVRAADILTVKLKVANINADSFHAGLTQAQRTQVLRDFKDKKIDILVATDLAARGIDIEQLAYVVNYDLPRSTEDYIHRIGRTARAGTTGVAISFIGHEDKAHFTLIEKRTRVRIQKESIQGFELTGDPLPEIKGKAPVKGSRMSKKDKARAAKKEESSV